MNLHTHVATLAHQRRSRSTMLAWGLCALTLAMVLLCGWASFHQHGPIALSPISFAGAVYLAVVIGIPYATIGALIAARRPENAIGWTLLAIGTLSMLFQFLSAVSHSSHPIDVHAAAVIAGANEIVWMLPPVLLITLVPLLFPNGRAPGRRWTWLYGVAALAAGCVLFASVAQGWTSRGEIAAGATTLPDPTGGILTILLVALAATMVGTIGAFASLIVRYRHARATEREQLKWFMLGLLIVVITIIVEMIVIPDVSPLEQIVWLATLALPISIAIGILRYRLFDIDVVISRTLLWTMLTVFVVGAYVLIVGFIGTLLADSNKVVLSIVATGIVAVCFQPVRARLQAAINRRIFGDRDDPYAAIARLGRQLERVTNPQAMLSAIAESVAQGLRLPYAAIALREGDHYALAASYGTATPRGTTLTLPLVSSSEQVGELILAPRTQYDRFSPSDLRLLEDLSRQIGVAAHAVQLTTDLQRSRERLVIAQEEERRRIRNDLHDGLGPVLSGLKLRAETARNLVGDNPPVDALLADIASRTETAVADVRRLVYSLRPPALDDLGLAAALKELGEQSSLPVAIELPDPMPPLPAAVEVAVYRISQEALTNAARHAGARHCRLILAVDVSSVRLTIADDGHGFEGEPSSGVGLRSMRERAAELGGRCTIDSTPGSGTTVNVTLPHVAEPERRVDGR